MRRVVITGMGMVTPLGVGVAHNWTAITSGKTGIRKIEHFDAIYIFLAKSKVNYILSRNFLLISPEFLANSTGFW